MPGLQGKELDSSIGVVGTLPQATLVESGKEVFVSVCEGVVVVVCCWPHHVRCELT
jgi:hypothetical protein